MKPILNWRSGTTVTPVQPPLAQPMHAAIGVQNTINSAPVPQLHIFNLNVNQGAGILFVVTLGDGSACEIVYGFLIDGGHALHAAQVRHILNGHDLDAVCITHEDADHADCPIEFDVPQGNRFLPQNPLCSAKPVQGVVPALGTITRLWPDAAAGAEWNNYPRLEIEWKHVWNGASRMIDPPNSMSLAGLVKWGAFTYYFDGDLDDQRQDEMAFFKPPLLVDCSYVTHHGSKYSTSADFLNYLKPTVAIISSGSNSFQHPTTFTLARLAALADLQHVFLTNCDYNRPQVNPDYWAHEMRNFHTMLNADIGAELDRDKLKRLGEFSVSLLESVDSLEAPLTIPMTSDQITARVMLDAASERHEQNLQANAYHYTSVGKLADFNYLQAAELDNLIRYYATLPNLAHAKFKVAGTDTTKSAVVITLSGFNPATYQVSYLHATGSWIVHYVRVNAAPTGPEPDDYCTDVPNEFYQRSELVVACPQFGKSNRKARTFDRAPKYKCVKCNHIVNDLSELVLFNCRACKGQRAYHAACLAKAIGTTANPIEPAVVQQISEHAYLGTATEPLLLAADIVACPRPHREARPKRDQAVRNRVRRDAGAAFKTKKTRVIVAKGPRKDPSRFKPNNRRRDNTKKRRGK